MKQLRIFGLLVAVLAMTSCNKTKDEATGTGDVFIVSQKVESTTVYGLSMAAYTLSAFSNVKVVSSADTTKVYTLASSQGFNSSMFYDTPVSEFTSTKPTAATFTFSAIFQNGVKEKFQNILTDVVLPIPTFEKCAYNDTTHRLEMNWTSISTANVYTVNILDGSKMVFNSVLLKNSVSPGLALRADGGGWDPTFTPASGKTYKVRLFAYMYEPGGGPLNIQSISIADSTVVWGN